MFYLYQIAEYQFVTIGHRKIRELNFIFCLLVFCILTPSLANAQLKKSNVLNLSYLEYNTKVPEGLLSERTVVLVDDNLANNTGEQKKGLAGWQAFATKSHNTFAKLGIDAVAYYNLDLVLSGRAVTKSFSEDIKSRAIAYAIVLSRSLTPSNDTLFSITLGQLSKNDFFFEAGQQAFLLQANHFSECMGKFIRAVSSSGLDRTNFLILDVPEFFNDTKLFTGRRFESYNPDLKLDKLAVPLFEERMAPQKIPPGMSRNEITAEVASVNQSVQKDNEKLKEIMGNYPFSSGPVEYEQGEQGWKKEGYQFALLNIHGKAVTIKDLLSYQSSVKDQPTFTSTKMVGDSAMTHEMSKDENIYKFYIKHLPTGEIYLGDYWDAAPTWEEALQNFIENLKYALKVTDN